MGNAALPGILNPVGRSEQTHRSCAQKARIGHGREFNALSSI